MSDPAQLVRDPERVAAVRGTGLLDAPPQEAFDRLTRLATHVLKVPASFITLVDEYRDFYMSQCGFPEPLASSREQTGTTFCHYAIPLDQPLIINDTRADPVYRTVPTVQSMGVAAYAGIPMTTSDGQAIGSFCAVDYQPREWTQTDVEVLRELAESAMREIELRRWVAEAADAERQMRQVTESRARLVRGFSHDLKNPLGAADGHAALLQDEILGALSPEQKESVDRIRGSIRAALNLIGDLLELAQAEAGEIDVQRAPVDVCEVARAIVGEYRAQAETAGLSLETTLTADLPRIHSDAARVRQILGNLVSNALKYNEEGGRVTLRVELRDGTGGRQLAVDIVDTGVGIPEEKQHLLFQEFNRLDPERGPGAGVGLAISQRIARALGGEITVRSAAGAGSTFTLWLPVAE